MQFPKYSHDLRSPRERRRLHVAAAAIALGALMASAGVAAVDDPRPLDLQLSSALHRAGETLKTWQARLSHGLQVSLRAVADGNERPAAPADSRDTLVAEFATLRGLQPAIAASGR